MPKAQVAVENEHGVPKAQWKKWNVQQRGIFGAVFYTMTHGNQQRLFLHPEAVAIPAEHWRTVAWNTAWIAADAAAREQHAQSD